MIAHLILDASDSTSGFILGCGSHGLTGSTESAAYSGLWSASMEFVNFMETESADPDRPLMEFCIVTLFG